MLLFLTSFATSSQCFRDNPDGQVCSIELLSFELKVWKFNLSFRNYFIV